MIEGLLLVDKPKGVTSHDAVDQVRKALGTRKVGHAGTLDPMATGLLLMGVGRATRLLRFLGELPKSYEGAFRLGVRTTTLDADGEVVGTSPVMTTPEDVRRTMREKVGLSMQRPPAYSAVKVAGRKLYDAARAGDEIEAAPRPISVERFEPIRLDLPLVSFVCVVSSGTYVRVLASEVGDALGCGAHLTELRRTAVGPFHVRDAVPPGEPGEPAPIERVVAHLPRLELDAEEASAAGHGRPLGPAGIAGPYAVFDAEGQLIGVYEDEGARARPRVILAR